MLTGTRTSLFAVVPAIVYMLWSFPRLKLTSRILILAGLIAGALVLLPYLPQSALERLGTAGTSIASGDLGGRVFLWHMAIAEFLTSPLVGIGSGGFSSTSMAGTWVHNTFLSVLAETGMIGFVLFAVMSAIVTYQALRQPKESAKLWGCVLLIWVMGALSLSWEFRKATWLFFSFVVISANLPSARRRAEEDSVSPFTRAGLVRRLAQPGTTCCGARNSVSFGSSRGRAD